MASANTHGKKFFATGGSHVCSDDFFKAQALLAREEEVTEKTKLKKSLQEKAILHEKGMAILVEKAASFESNNYRDVSTKDLDILLQWYGVDKKGMKKAEKVERWRAIRVSGTEPPQLDIWTAEDEENLAKIMDKDIDMSETFLGRYAALQKRNAVAAVLEMSDEEWESLKALREAEAQNATNTNSDDNDNILGVLEAVNDLIGGKNNEEAV